MLTSFFFSLFLIICWWGINLNGKDICLEFVDKGPCNQNLVRWYWDAIDCRCVKFIYGGCLGTENRFVSKQDCTKECFYGRNNTESILQQRRKSIEHKIFPTHTSYIRNVTATLTVSDCSKCDKRISNCLQHSNGKFKCDCLLGYEENNDGGCSDVNECRDGLSDCNTNAWCTNTIGSYTCECIAGYEGNGRICEPNLIKNGNNRVFSECYSKELGCSELAICRNISEYCICECPLGYAGNGYNCTNHIGSCLDAFDTVYKEECDGDDFWRESYYYDHETKRCTLFWYNGCFGTSMNIFSDLNTCEVLCEENNALKIAGEWQQRYFFDHEFMTCRLFWYDGCPGETRNMFDDLLTCQWLCEEQPRYNSKSCIEPFDEHYRDECNGGKWRQHYYYDKTSKNCVAFWYDGCTGGSQNLFQDEITCIETCERAANEYDEANRKQDYKPETIQVVPIEIKMNASLENKQPQEVQPLKIVNETKNKDQTTSRAYDRNICEIANPCKNGGTCLYDSHRKIHVCKCASDYDPCASLPCKNGATCMAKYGKGRSTYECYCPIGFGGVNCDSRPCDIEPCKNNGTCRTTRTLPDFFCECQPGWGGKDCDIPIPNTVPPTYGRNVELISSGKVDWINELRIKEMQRAKEKTTKAPEPRDGAIRLASNKTRSANKNMPKTTEVYETEMVRNRWNPDGEDDYPLLGKSSSIERLKFFFNSIYLNDLISIGLFILIRYTV